MTVTCNTEYMELSIYLCPIYSSLYNESLMALNGEYNKDVCRGIPDWTVDPPVLRFKVSINETNESFCGSQTTVLKQIIMLLCLCHNIENIDKKVNVKQMRNILAVN